MAKAATAPDVEDPKVLDNLLVTGGWQTLVTIARESAGKDTFERLSTQIDVVIAPPRPSALPPASAPDPAGADDIPADLFDHIMEDHSGIGVGKVCPHCTFENASSNTDCEVCGLPLS